MTKFSEMSYDEQRALLGLPDVSRYVARYQLRRAFRLIEEAAHRLGLLGDGITQNGSQRDFTLARDGRADG